MGYIRTAIIFLLMAIASAHSQQSVVGFSGNVSPQTFTSRIVTNTSQLNQAWNATATLNAPITLNVAFCFVSNAFLANMIISNSVALPNLGYLTEFEDAVNLGVSGSARLPLYFNNIFAFTLSSSASTATAMGIVSGERVFGSDSYLTGPVALETRGTIGTFNGCTLEATNAGAATDTFAYLANDDSTNTFNNCAFISRNAVSDNNCIIQWVRSETIYNKCFFNVGGPSGSVNTVLNLAETPSRGIFNHCTFNLTYTNCPARAQLITFAQDSGTVELNDCFVFPPTNGVIIDNSSFTGTQITIRDGNIVPSNIKTINGNVTFVRNGLVVAPSTSPVGFNPDASLAVLERFVTNITAGIVKLNALTNVSTGIWFDFSCEVTNSHGSGGPFPIVFPPNVRTNIAGTVQQLTNQSYVRFSGVGGQYTNGFCQPQQ